MSRGTLRYIFYDLLRMVYVSNLVYTHQDKDLRYSSEILHLGHHMDLPHGQVPGCYTDVFCSVVLLHMLHCKYHRQSNLPSYRLLCGKHSLDIIYFFQYQSFRMISNTTICHLLDQLFYFFSTSGLLAKLPTWSLVNGLQ